MGGNFEVLRLEEGEFVSIGGGLAEVVFYGKLLVDVCLFFFICRYFWENGYSFLGFCCFSFRLGIMGFIGMVLY